MPGAIDYVGTLWRNRRDVARQGGRFPPLPQLLLRRLTPRRRRLRQVVDLARQRRNTAPEYHGVNRIYLCF